ncbi:HEAT repeat domain-containing protein [Altericista sp. CCNU0014]|uniref:HEAT repeat domain-containing protein n=1 Tax=Altericista sp. CCNU0014 TaxID=3082949 RepID=UPI00385163AF
MAKSLKLEETLALLDRIDLDLAPEEAIAHLKQAIGSKHAIAAARAAKLASKANLHGLIPDLATAFERFMLNAAATDPNCIAKKQIAEALYRLEYSQEDLFLNGIGHVQMESVWGGKVDTAPGLRGICALGLVRMNYSEVMVELADLLADPEPEARIGSARAIAYAENPQGVPLLRLKVKVGDKDPQVLSECFMGLLQLAPTQSLDLIAEFLDRPEAQVCEMAALALGESRLPAAFPILRDWWRRTRNAELRQSALLAIAMLRQDEALAFLLALVAEGKLAEAKEAAIALDLYRQDRHVWQRICEAIEQRGDDKIQF